MFMISEKTMHDIDDLLARLVASGRPDAEIAANIRSQLNLELNWRRPNVGVPGGRAPSGSR